jgi:hypothetical protein
MQYITEHGASGFFNCDERVINSKCQEIASNYFRDNPEAENYSICVVDFEKNTSKILCYQIEISITCTEY